MMMPPSKPPVEGRKATGQSNWKNGAQPMLQEELIMLEVSGKPAYQRSRASWDSNSKRIKAHLAFIGGVQDWGVRQVPGALEAMGALASSTTGGRTLSRMRATGYYKNIQKPCWT